MKTLVLLVSYTAFLICSSGCSTTNSYWYQTPTPNKPLYLWRNSDGSYYNQSGRTVFFNAGNGDLYNPSTQTYLWRNSDGSYYDQTGRTVFYNTGSR